MLDCKTEGHILLGEYDGEPVIVSDIMTTKADDLSYPEKLLEIYAVNKEIDLNEIIFEADAHSYMMNILDYLVGNVDRHWGNWGFLIDNQKNKLILTSVDGFQPVFQA